MTESSGLWTTDASPSGDQVTSYTQAIATDMLRIAAACSGFEGVAPGYESELAPSTTGAFNVRIAAGGALVDGKFYKNTANVDKTLDTPTAGTTRIDRVVVEITWASFECEITVIKGTESGGTPSAPSIPSTAGTNYAIQLCQALVNNAGDVTITDERKWAIVDTDESTLEDNAGLLRVKDSGITAAKIANRTRSFLAEITSAYNSSSGEIQRGAVSIGWPLSNTYLCNAYCNFRIPQDYAASLTVQPIWWSTGGSGNIYYKTEARYGAATEDYDAHSTLGSYAALAVSVGVLQVGTALSLTDAAAGDIVSMNFYGDGSNGAWTYDGALYLTGIIVSYTADS